LMMKTLQLQRAPARTGMEAFVGESARVIRGFTEPHGRGTVQVFGEYWDAVGPEGLQPGEAVRVRRVEGRILHVERRHHG
jgi:membrane protein implicated in regulation of membrane protease activity